MEVEVNIVVFLLCVNVLYFGISTIRSYRCFTASSLSAILALPCLAAIVFTVVLLSFIAGWWTILVFLIVSIFVGIGEGRSMRASLIEWHEFWVKYQATGMLFTTVLAAVSWAIYYAFSPY